MSSIHDDKSPDEIEREVEEARARLASTLGEIRERMSPGQLVDQAIDYARASGGGEFTRNFGRSVRDNPLPVALVGLGIGWLFMADRMGPPQPRDRQTSWFGRGEHLSGRRMARGAYHPDDRFDGDRDGIGEADLARGYPPAEGGRTSRGFARGLSEAEHREPSALSSAYGSARDGVRSVAHGAGSVASGIAGAASTAYDTVTGAASGVASAVSGAASAVGHAASAVGHAASAVGSGAGRAASSVGSGLGSARDYGRRYAHDARDGISGIGSGLADLGSGITDAASYAGRRMGDMQHTAQGRIGRMIEEQPLLLGAFGLVMGAALGAMLPRTRAEGRWFGETAEQVRRQAADYAQQGFEAARETARETFDQATSTLDERGFSTRNAGEALGAVAETVKSALGAEDRGNGQGQSGQSGPSSSARPAERDVRSGATEGTAAGASSAPSSPLPNGAGTSAPRTTPTSQTPR